MFKKEIKPLSEGMADSITKSINKLQHIEEKASRSADHAEGDVKPADISGEEEVKADGSAKKAPARKGDKAVAEAYVDEKSCVGEMKKLHASSCSKTEMYKKVSEKYGCSEEKFEELYAQYCKETYEEVQEDNSNDKSDDGEGMDKVQPKAVKKKFADRKDKDIDNDGDEDDSDKFLHKRRKAISKALESKKPNASVDESAELEGLDEGFSPKDIKMAIGIASDKRYKGGNMTGAVKAINKLKRGLSDHPQVSAVLKRQNEELEEAKPPQIKKGKAKGTISATGMRGKGNKKFDVDVRFDNGKFVFRITDESGKFDTVDIKKASRILGEERVAELTEKKYSPSDEKDIQKTISIMKKYPANKKKSNKELRDGAIEYLFHESNQGKMFDIIEGIKIDEDMKIVHKAPHPAGGQYIVLTKPGKGQHVIRHLNKGKVKELGTVPSLGLAKSYVNAKSKGKDPKKMGILKAHYKEDVSEAKKSDYTIYHKTFSSAVQHAVEVAKKRGYEVDSEDYDRKVAMGPRKPGKGKTNSYAIDLKKNGKDVRNKLQMQVYYDEGRYELNMYIS